MKHSLPAKADGLDIEITKVSAIIRFKLNAKKTARNLLLAERSRKPGLGEIHGGEKGLVFEGLLCYALGRDVSFTDLPLIEAVLDDLEADQYPVRELVKRVVTSEPFLNR